MTWPLPRQPSKPAPPPSRLLSVAARRVVRRARVSARRHCRRRTADRSPPRRAPRAGPLLSAGQRGRGAMADGDAASAAAQLSGLSVKFTEGRGGSATWRLGCDAKRVADAAGWSAEHDAALLSALRALEALQGLPGGPKARDASAWLRAQNELRFVRSELAAPAFKPERAREHKCSPGYDCIGCKQVRRPGACAGPTLETLPVPSRRARCLRRGATAFARLPARRAPSRQPHTMPLAQRGSCRWAATARADESCVHPNGSCFKLTVVSRRRSACTSGQLSRLRCGCACARTSWRSCGFRRAMLRCRLGTSGAARSGCPPATWAAAWRRARRASQCAGRAPRRCRAAPRRPAGVQRRQRRRGVTTRRRRRRAALPRTRR